MRSGIFLTRTRLVATLLSGAMLSQAAAASEMPTFNCRGRWMQNACLQQEICIDDPGKLPKALVVKLSLKKRTYVAGSMTGTITAVDASDKEKLKLTIDPSIRGGTLIEFSADRRKAKLVGGEYNYFLKCRTRL